LAKTIEALLNLQHQMGSAQGTPEYNINIRIVDERTVKTKHPF